MLPNPFGKNLADLELNDLAALRTVSEGWYFEYKRQLIAPRDIAKSVSAFANTYGGWLFFGVLSSSSSRCAEAFQGLRGGELGDAEIRIREAASGNLNPAPFFETRILTGPCDELGLDESQGIVVVRIPQGFNAPYIHSSGRIFRRIGDQSSPREETDRHILDQLWGRSQKHGTEFSQQVGTPPFRTESQASVPVLKMFFFHDLWKDGDTGCNLSHRRFREIATTQQLPFGSVFPASDGHIGLQVQGNNPAGLLLQWRHRYGCIDEVTFPLNTLNLDSSYSPVAFSDYAYGLDFFRLCRSANFESVRVVDLSHCWSLMFSAAQVLGSIDAVENTQRPIHCKLQISGARGIVPFVDTESFLANIRSHGIPIVQDELALCPYGASTENVIELETRSQLPDQDPLVLAFSNSLKMFLQLTRGFGFEISATGFPEFETEDEYDHDAVMNWWTEIQAAADRSRVATRTRTIRDGRGSLFDSWTPLEAAPGSTI